MSTRYGSATVVLPSDTTILITRSFDAPAALLVRALTEPELVTRWRGLEEAQWEVCEIDLRVGGTWRYVVRQPCESEPDREIAFHGEYRELDPPHRLVSTEVFEGVPEGKAVVSTTLDEVDGVTRRASWCNTVAKNTATATSNRAWRSACRSATTASKTCFATSDDKNWPEIVRPRHALQPR
ncbi:activator of Hsp90 ATPase 1 family protein [Mycobacteroides abscessus subsp. bolletii]|nr:activator of Hsp90 ATPase 1 family protein [Mycobacteroides abscessus]SKE72088.1 activator of Hsp90 ATPase 1 family protein [Mycobacteroides abscessus subsp. bolletii]SKF99760.1 activator of Hsp90 ATPase 1 family protein [Mycobacteroides abscessus subsp. bolletii]